MLTGKKGTRSVPGFATLFLLPVFVYFSFPVVLKKQPSLVLEGVTTSDTRNSKAARKNLEIRASYSDGSLYRKKFPYKGEGPHLIEGKYYILDGSKKRYDVSSFGDWSCEIANVADQDYLINLDLPFADMKRRLNGRLVLNGVLHTEDGAGLSLNITLE